MTAVIALAELNLQQKYSILILLFSCIFTSISLNIIPTDARWGDKNNPSPRYVIPLKYGAGVKKSEEINPSQPNNQSEENASSNPPNNNQSILSNVNVGGNLTIGNITQTSNSGAIPPPNPSNVTIDNRTINSNQGNYNENIGGDYIQGNRGEDTGKKQN